MNLCGTSTNKQIFSDSDSASCRHTHHTASDYDSGNGTPSGENYYRYDWTLGTGCSDEYSSNEYWSTLLNGDVSTRCLTTHYLNNGCEPEVVHDEYNTYPAVGDAGFNPGIHDLAGGFSVTVGDSNIAIGGFLATPEIKAPPQADKPSCAHETYCLPAEQTVLLGDGSKKTVVDIAAKDRFFVPFDSEPEGLKHHCDAVKFYDNGLQNVPRCGKQTGIFMFCTIMV